MKFRIYVVALLLIVVAFPGQCKNYFNTLLGISDEECAEKITSLWNHFFTHGDISRYEDMDQTSVYYLDGDKGFILDTGNNDVRTEGMSYGMMISVQLDQPEVFDRLWKWSKAHMAYGTDSPWDGYFCWQCLPDGTKIGGSNASDGELYYVTSLFLAGKRWNKPEYNKDANDILRKIMSKNGADTGIYNLFDNDSRLITFVPDKSGHGFTDPSYQLPAFLDYWAKTADSDRDFWKEAATAARDHLIETAHPVTGLHPDYSTYDGKPYRWPMSGYDTSMYMYDAIRCAMNIGMDSYLAGKDTERQKEVITRLLEFFDKDNHTHGHFNLDGSNPSGTYSCGMAGSNAVGALALIDSNTTDSLALTDSNTVDSLAQADSESARDRELATEAVRRLWNTAPPRGKYRYYEGMVYFLSMLHVSGNFSLDF